MRELTELEDRIRQMSWPAPSDDLRARVLTEAAVSKQVIAWSDRVWFSLRWRLSMTAATLGLLLIQWLSGPGETARAVPASGMVAEAQAIEEGGRQAGLPDELAASMARRAIAEGQSRAIEAHTFSWIESFDKQGELR